MLAAARPGPLQPMASDKTLPSGLASADPSRLMSLPLVATMVVARAKKQVGALLLFANALRNLDFSKVLLRS